MVKSSELTPDAALQDVPPSTQVEAAEIDREVLDLEQNPELPEEYLPAAITAPDAVREAAIAIHEYHPLRSFIHCNALHGMQDLPFDDAMAVARRLYGSRGYMSLADYKAALATGRIAQQHLDAARAEARAPSTGPLPTTVETLADILDRQHKLGIVTNVNRQMIKWCGAYLDQTQAQWALDKNGGLFVSWRKHARSDLTLSLHGSRGWKECLRNLPDEREAALTQLLEKLGVPAELFVPYLRRHLIQLPGWASHVKWREVYGDEQLLTEFLIIRLFYELQLSRPFTERVYKGDAPYQKVRSLFPAPAEVVDHEAQELAIWQEAFERSFAHTLLGQLRNQNSDGNAALAAPACHLVLCMDVRSEPVRRELDKYADYNTFGFAGFFGFPMRFRELGSALSLDLAPVLLKPEKHVREVSEDKSAKRLSTVQAILAAAVHLQKRLKSSLAGAFGLVETFGPWSSFPLMGRTFAPKHFDHACERTQKLIAGDPETHLDTSEFAIEEKIVLGASKLRAIGLWQNFAPVVVLCGHKSESRNNPYGSALDCGACGGQPGGTSARFAASVFNDPKVRDGLRQKGIDIPGGTIFVAAEHNTTTDTFELFLGHTLLTPEQRRIVDKLRVDLRTVGMTVKQNRTHRLPKSAVGLSHPDERAHDWAQVTPEWGLSRHASFIAGPRSLTRGIDLEGRAFLQSYDYTIDEDGSILEQVMTAPMVVAQWINAEFYLSTVDNDVFGSGSKVVHNVVGDFGVMQGAVSDLRLGLPWQSVMSAEDTPDHEPMRLLCIIQAPPESIDRVLEKHESVAALVTNRWIRLVALDPADGTFKQCSTAGTWVQLA